MNYYDILVRLNLYVMTEKKLDLGLQAFFFGRGVVAADQDHNSRTGGFVYIVYKLVTPPGT